MLSPGSIDVNIMTKLDGAGIKRVKDENEVEFNDAHAALRGFARSNLKSSVVFSAGLNPRLYGYIAKFDDFETELILVRCYIGVGTVLVVCVR